MSESPEEQTLPPSPLEVGLQHLREGRVSDALHALHEAYYVCPTDRRLHEALGAIYLQTGQPERAAAYVRYAKYLAPQAPGVLYQEALLHLQRGQSKVAEALLRRIVETAPDFAPAREALESELARRQMAAALPEVLSDQRPWVEYEVVPHRYTGPDGRDRLRPPRAPHHCANCFYRAGQHPRPMSAGEYQWINLGLLAAVFLTWVAYLIWTVAGRRHLLQYTALYCEVCHRHYRDWSNVFGLAVAWVSIFGLATLLTLPWAMSSSSAWAVGTFVVLAILAAGGLVWAAVARRRQRAQLALRLRPLGEEAVLFGFQNAQYAEAFRQLNADCVFARGTVAPDGRAEALSFVPLLAATPAPAEAQQGTESHG